MKKIIFILFCFCFSGCANIRNSLPFMKKKDVRLGGVYKENLDQDRIVDLVIVRKFTGEKTLGLFSKYASFLEGYIRGVTVDYEDNPIQGVIVRVTDKSKDLAGYDPGVSDINGVYRIRFSLPVKNNKVDVSGTISYNAPWQQQLEILGAALEPQTKETKFRLYYDQKAGIIGIGEDTPKTITRKVTEAGMKKESESKTKESADKEDRKTKTEQKKEAPSADQKTPQKKDDDFFGGFGDFK